MGSTATGYQGMDVTVSRTLPGYVMGQTFVFGHSTRLVDSWSPDLERIWLPERVQPEVEFRVTVRPERVLPPRRWGGRSRCMKLWRAVVRRGGERRVLRRPRTLMFDARYWYDGNVAHILENVVARLTYARRLLRESGHGDPRIEVILPGNATRLALEAYRYLGVPVVRWDGPVECHRVTVVPERRAPSVFPYVLNGPIEGDGGGVPEQVFISRKGGRGVANEREVHGLLREHGYQRVFFEDLSFARQWSILRHARRIVAVHGAALGGLVFRESAAPFQVIELFGAGYMVSRFRESVAALGGRWCGVRGRVTPRVVRDLDERQLPRSHATGRFRIDPQSLSEALRFMSDSAAASGRGGGSTVARGAEEIRA